MTHNDLLTLPNKAAAAAAAAAAEETGGGGNSVNEKSSPRNVFWKKKMFTNFPNYDFLKRGEERKKTTFVIPDNHLEERERERENSF